MAVFTVSPATLTVGTVSPAGAGSATITTGGATGDVNRSVTVQAGPNPGYVFSHWAENGSQVNTANPWQFTLTGDRTLVAVFSVAEPTFIAALGASPTSNALRDANITLPLRLSRAASETRDVASYTARITWDIARVTVDSLRGRFGSTTVNSDSAALGVLRIAAFAAEGMRSDSTLAILHLRGTQLGNTTLGITVTALGDELGTSLIASVRGRDHLLCVVNAAGMYGDVNGDGPVNIIDAQQIARYSVGLSVFNPGRIPTHGDVNGDGFVNILDAQQIARYSVGLPSSPRTGQLIPGGTCE